MVTIANITENLIENRPFIQEALIRGIINYGSLADELLPEVKKISKKKVKHSAVMMALRRYKDKLDKISRPPKSLTTASDLTLKSGLFKISIIKSNNAKNLIKSLYTTIDYSSGEILNIIQGNHELDIVSNMTNLSTIQKLLKNENIIKLEKNLVALSVKYTKKTGSTPGVLYTFIRSLTWDSINIKEIISTLTETTFIINKDDATVAYLALEKVL